MSSRRGQRTGHPPRGFCWTPLLSPTPGFPGANPWDGVILFSAQETPLQGGSDSGASPLHRPSLSFL